ncbi:phosphoserine transaminase [Calidifontibacter indicus]|uniref:phosphoserine transaminase n=1 Tax=Calidifontibacter indicus TaxID=419650 RepID=A0A3D9ULH8_9MICO|nr:phosphoserine transaminase [Calidifontibacter indicus]REF30196.1 phosphoserine aminotransferase [Calidifontibacter indicus]
MNDVIQIPTDLLPADGRFGSGPSKVRPEQLDSLVAQGRSVMGTSHRQAPVLNLVASVQERMAQLYSLPDGYEVVLGLGGSTGFWDVAACSLVRARSQHAVFGEFSSKFAAVATAAPFLTDPEVRLAEPGAVADLAASDGIDLYATAHNETSTGAMVPIRRVDSFDALTVVDGTSAAGGTELDVAQTDVYYFAPQKSFASDGGLWIALMSPAALERAAEVTVRTDRWVPETLNLQTAITNSRKHQTLNTPALATLVLLDEQLGWMLELGGLAACAARTADSSTRLYSWAEGTDFATPFIADPAHRSQVVGTIDFDDSVDAAALAATLRANGIVDTEPYRKLGRNQLRIGMYPAVDPDDVTALTRCIDHVVGAQRG